MAKNGGGIPSARLRDELRGKPVTVGNMMDATASRYPDTEALVFYDHARGMEHAERYTYLQYKQRADQLAKCLMAIGVAKGDRVAIWMPNCPEWAFAQMATGKIGAAHVSVNTMLKTQEVEYVLRNSDSQTLLIADEFLGTDYMSMLTELSPELATCEFGYLQSTRLPMLKNIITLSRKDRSRSYTGAISFDELMEKYVAISDKQLEERQRSVAEGDVAQILYTSGTTGLPKGAALIQKGVLENSFGFGIGLGCHHGDVYINPQPLFHIGCSHLGTYCSLTLGLTLITVDRWNPERNLRIIQKEAVTTICGTPTHYITMMQHADFEQYDVSSLRTGLMGGSACPVQLVRDVMSKMHVPDLTINFGQTETCGSITQTRLDASPELRAETVGVALPGVEVAIKEPLTNVLLALGEVGEICCRSSNNMLGYYNDPEATAKTIDADGWLHLGDLGTLDNDGNLRFRGRVKDMIIVGGENVYAAEVEKFLERHPKVTAAHMIGVPDSKYGEVVMAYLQTSEELSFAEVHEFCKGKIAPYKIPRYIACNAELPLTPSAKVQKFRLREIAISMLSLRDA